MYMLCRGLPYFCYHIIPLYIHLEHLLLIHMDIKKSTTPLPQSCPHNKNCSCQLECYMMPDACQMHKTLIEHSSKVLSDERQFNQWRTLIGKLPKPDPTEKSMLKGCQCSCSFQG